MDTKNKTPKVSAPETRKQWRNANGNLQTESVADFKARLASMLPKPDTKADRPCLRKPTDRGYYPPSKAAPNKAQYSPLPWTLHRLDDQWNGEKRWSAGVNGPRIYLTCDEDTAQLIVRAVNHADKLAIQLGRLERLARDTIGADGALLMGCDNARKALAEYEAAQ